MAAFVYLMDKRMDGSSNGHVPTMATDIMATVAGRSFVADRHCESLTTRLYLSNTDFGRLTLFRWAALKASPLSWVWATGRRVTCKLSV